MTKLEELCRWLFCRADCISFEDYDEDKPDDARMLCGDLEILDNYGTGELIRVIDYAKNLLNESFEISVNPHDGRISMWVQSEKIMDDYEVLADYNFNCSYLKLALDKNGFVFDEKTNQMYVNGLYYLSPKESQNEWPVYDGT